MQKQIIRLTGNLLAAGAFRHLPDEEVSRIYFLLQEANSSRFQQYESLIRFWYRANFFSMGVPEFLIHQCNECALHMQLPGIEGWVQGYAA